MDCYEFDQKIKSGTNSDSLFQELTPAIRLLAGVDEVGRGPLAGPVVAAAVILPESPLLYGLRDSKIVPVEQREALYCEITESASAVAVSIIEMDVIDSINILAASLKAMREAVQSLGMSPDLVLVDGNQKPGTGFPEMAIIKGDGCSASIMAASIVAKVTRDHIMMEAHEIYPQYGFDEHKGYACEKHLRAIEQYGPCALHRKSFEPIKSILQREISVTFL